MAGTYGYRIEPRDIDATLRVRLYTLGDLVLQAASDDADTLGFGVGDLNLGNASWVLSRMALEMKRLPGRHEHIDIHTWVSDYGRLVTTRNMVIRCKGGTGGCTESDDEGVEIGAAVTQWAMIDLSTRRPLDLSALSGKGTSLVDREPPIERPRKIGGCGRNAGGESSYTKRDYGEISRTVVYSDIDFNGHTGSMKYLEWMVDMLPAGVLARMSGAESPDEAGASGGTGDVRFDINYLHEARLGDELIICKDIICQEIEKTSGGDNHNGHHHRFDILKGDISVCRACISI